MATVDRQPKLMLTGLGFSLGAMLLTGVAVVVPGTECGSLRRFLNGFGVACETTAVSTVALVTVGALVLLSWVTYRKTRPGQPRPGERWVVVRGGDGRTSG